MERIWCDRTRSPDRGPPGQGNHGFHGRHDIPLIGEQPEDLSNLFEVVDDLRDMMFLNRWGMHQISNLGVLGSSA